MVQPLGVIDHAHERLLLSDLGEQAEYGQTDDEAIGGRSRAQAERGREGITLRAGQTLPEIEHRCAQLMQSRIGELHLVLNTHRSQDATPGRASDHVFKQRRLANARLPAQDEGPADTTANRVEEAVEGRALGGASAQGVLRGHGPPFLRPPAVRWLPCGYRTPRGRRTAASQTNVT